MLTKKPVYANPICLRWAHISPNFSHPCTLSKCSLNIETVPACTTSSGSSFHMPVTLGVKNMLHRHPHYDKEFQAQFPAPYNGIIFEISLEVHRSSVRSIPIAWRRDRTKNILGIMLSNHLWVKIKSCFNSISQTHTKSTEMNKNLKNGLILSL